MSTPARLRVWTEERIAGLIEMTKSGLSQAAIARVMGMTKNQIVGALDRARRNGEDVEFNCGYAVKRRRTLEARGELPPVKPEPASAIRDEWFVGGCRWIDADPRDPDWRWCGKPLVKGSAYCAEHLRRTGSGVFLPRVKLPRG
jgi:GcrA cell cycle regulator